MVITSDRDEHGRASFTMFWTSDGAVRHRAQCFRAEVRIKRGNVIVVEDEATAKRLAWKDVA